MDIQEAGQGAIVVVVMEKHPEAAYICDFIHTALAVVNLQGWSPDALATIGKLEHELAKILGA